jgi:hypothetical protein
MRPTSSLSLLLFLKLTTSTPIPHHRDYHEYESPLEPDFAKPATPPTTLSNPHFPPHQLQSLNADSQFDKPFDNRPKTPPAEIPPSVALSTETPLTSAYLLYIIRPPPSTIELPSTTTSDEEEALPSKPTAALAQLRKLDSVRYWASLQPNASPKPKIVPPTLPTFEQLKFEEKEFPESETSSNEGPVSSIMRCQEYIMGAGSNAYMSMSLARDYGDLLVVGIVVLFLGLVVVSEVIIKAVDL